MIPTYAHWLRDYARQNYDVPDYRYRQLLLEVIRTRQMAVSMCVLTYP